MRPIRPLLVLCAVLLATTAQAVYTTPGLGVDWTLDNLVAASAGAVTGGGSSYEVHDSVVIAVSDRVTISPGTTLTFFGGITVGIAVNGALVAVGSEAQPIVFTATAATPGAWRGLDYENTGVGSEFHLAWCEIAYSDIAVDVFGADILVEDCRVHHAANRAFDFSSANGIVRRCTIRDNQTRTITATLTSSPLIEDCWFENNNIQNTSPYPYINIGLQGVNSPTIRRNSIHGSGHHLSGGISIWAASNAYIVDNYIEGCGYGILCYSTGANPRIDGNHLHANTIHPDQVNFGFGVACNGNNAPILTNNQIELHWYGVAAINGGHPNLGDITNAIPGDDGNNFIVDNGIGENRYNFYNNTPLAQMAQNNFWGANTAEGVEATIYHQVDDPALGLVNFDPFIVEIVDVPGAVSAALLTDARAYPNPFNPRVEIAFAIARPAHVSLAVIDLAGRVVRELPAGDLEAGDHRLTWDGTDRAGRALASGTYFYRVVAGGESRVGKLVLVR
jgi:parallel beta-helix repeat protein